MNLHMNAHFPIVPVAVAVTGLLLLALVEKKPWNELGRAALWAGMFAATLAAS
jgi:hypothetical protein